jgi:hypothetical protein
MPDVEQAKLKRAGTGLRASDPERACPGYTLYTPLAGDGTVYLLDLLGQVVHTWRLPYPPGQYGYLTERGTLFYNGKIADESWYSTQRWKAGAALEVDWQGRVLWEVRHPTHHHDGICLRNGNVLLLCMAPLPPDLAARVRGGRPGTEAAGVMHGDCLVELTTAGEVVWEWRAWEHLDPAADAIVAEQEPRYVWTMGNGVAEWPDGRLTVSFRNICTVVTIDRPSGAIVWKLGAPPLSHQHAPTPLPNGNLLIFDNGTHRRDHFLPYSRVIEVEPATKRIVWQYQEGHETQFFSPLISNAQRLPNGNTLICEGEYGRIFEVLPDGTLVWEYVNPHFHGPPRGQANRVFRAYRYGEEQIARARTTGQ